MKLVIFLHAFHVVGNIFVRRCYRCSISDWD